MNPSVCLEHHQEQLSGQPDAAVFLDSRGIPVSPTAEAIRVLIYPQKVPSNGKRQRLVLQRMRSLFPAGPLANATPPAGEFLSGRRRYLYRVYRFRDSSPGEGVPVAILFLERHRAPLDPSEAHLEYYHFTVREGQVLRLVLEGLSNRQIAERMGISPNTVKAFLRLIMTKMDVTSRFGILGKLLGRAESRERAAWRRARTSVTGVRIARNL